MFLWIVNEKKIKVKMKVINYFLSAIILTFMVQIGSTGPTTIKQSCNLIEADKCASDVFVFGYSNITLPADLQQVENHCK